MLASKFHCPDRHLVEVAGVMDTFTNSSWYSLNLIFDRFFEGLIRKANAEGCGREAPHAGRSM